MNNCVACHDVHTQQIQLDKCGTCHAAKTLEDLQKIRKPNDTTDWNGNKNNTEGFGEEIKGMQDKLYAAIQNYAKTRIKVTGADGKPANTQIVYDPASYPYFFIDTNGDGKTDPAEVNSKNAFTYWTPRLLRAAYNYQWVQKDPGAFAHNFYYIDQILYELDQGSQPGWSGRHDAGGSNHPADAHPCTDSSRNHGACSGSHCDADPNQINPCFTLYVQYNGAV